MRREIGCVLFVNVWIQQFYSIKHILYLKIHLNITAVILICYLAILLVVKKKDNFPTLFCAGSSADLENGYALKYSIARH